MDYSIIVLSFHSDYAKLLLTLDSILVQKEVSFEILICDDASPENHFDQIKDYFTKKNFYNFKLLGSETNQGTVRNILKGLSIASGTYAKLIGVGDMLYNTHTLSDVKHFMEKQQASCCFGLMHGYQKKGEHYIERMRYSPRDILAYRKQNLKKITRNLLLAEDWVSGASIFATTDYYKKYISMLKDKVLYCEDWATALSVADHIYPAFLDQYTVWYEVGDGISTNVNSSFRQKLLLDNKNFWDIFDAYSEKQAPGEFRSYIKKRKRKKKFDHLSNEIIKLLLKSLTNPELVFLEYTMQKEEKANLHIPSKETATDFFSLSEIS